MEKGFVIAIDGPVASGKGTIAPKLARKVGGINLYTGATYRSVALFCIENGIDVSDKSKVIQSLPNINIDLRNGAVFLNQRDVTDRIRESQVASASPEVSAFKEVRETMVDVQRRIAQREIDNGKIVIAEGRDTGTKVFPNAKLKIYLTADPVIRAKRRFRQNEETGMNLDFEKVLEETLLRDKKDTERIIDPLVKEPEKFGYIVVDNSKQSENETIDIIVKELRKVGVNV
jgi:cytidylate kinase